MPSPIPTSLSLKVVACHHVLGDFLSFTPPNTSKGGYIWGFWGDVFFFDRKIHHDGQPTVFVIFLIITYTVDNENRHDDEDEHFDSTTVTILE